jgi:hypothetical protein
MEASSHTLRAGGREGRGESGGGGEFLGCVAERAGAHTSAQRVTGRGEGRGEGSGEGRGEGGWERGRSVLHCDMEGIMHALIEQQRQSFEQHAHVLAVLQEQGRQLHGLLIDREKSDNATNREHGPASSMASPSDTGRNKQKQALAHRTAEQQKLALETESLSLFLSLSHALFLSRMSPIDKRCSIYDTIVTAFLPLSTKKLNHKERNPKELNPN